MRHVPIRTGVAAFTTLLYEPALSFTAAVKNVESQMLQEMSSLDIPLAHSETRIRIYLMNTC